MNRRDFLAAGLAAGTAAATVLSAQRAGKSHFYELRTYELRNDLEVSRVHGFFRDHYIPAMKKQGVGPVGCFNVISGEISPALVVLVDYDSLEQVKPVTELLASNRDLAREWKAFETGSPVPYVRYQSVLLKAFAGHPQIEPPSAKKDKSGHLFELRTYESKNVSDLNAKIDMFNQEEIQIFRDCGFAPVFFGEGLFARRLPHLTYMVAFDDMIRREKAWDTFRANPDWNRIKDKPQWRGTVSVIHARFLSPTDYSEVR